MGKSLLWTFLLFFRSFSKNHGDIIFKIREAKRMEHILTWEMMREYEKHLRLAEKSSSTIQKYLHDIWRFYEHLPRGKCLQRKE